MLASIEQINNEIEQVEQEQAFLKNFEQPFLDSERAPFYLGHENGVLYAGEWVVRLRARNALIEEDGPPDDILTLQQEKQDLIKLSSPEESWHFFINDKLKPLKDLGLLE